MLSDVLTGVTTNPQLDSYNTVDFDLKYNGNQNTEYFLRVNNIFNAKYWETASYPAAGINFMLGVNHKM